MKHYKIISLFAVLLFLSGCEHKVNQAYVPGTILEIDAQIYVEQFQYTPPSQKIKRNEIVITAGLDSLILPKPLNEVFREGIQKEFRFAGISIKEGGCSIGGTLHHILYIVSLSSKNVTDIKATYTLNDKNNNVIYSATHSIKEKFGLHYTMSGIADFINRGISKNINDLLNNEQFRKALEKC